MDINRVNNLLGHVRVKLESLDPENLDEMEMQVGRNYDTDDDTLEVAKVRLQHLLDKLSAGRGEGNRIRETGTK